MKSALQEAVHAAVAGRDLSDGQMASAMAEVLEGEGDPALLAALAVALRMKGERSSELFGAARALRARCQRIRVDGVPILADTCGTGGDGLGTFNVSTASAFVVAAAGVPVAKHGNRAVSSKAGSADVLEALGLPVTATPALVEKGIRELGLGFLYAPQHHQALRHAAPVRKALGLRTFFNLLGPLANPAGATHQLIGVYDPDKLDLMATVLGKLGTQAAWVVHGAGGLDEISPLGPTEVAELKDGAVRRFTVSPADFGYPVRGQEALAGGDAKENAAILLELFRGAKDPRREVVVMNAAAVLHITGATPTLRAAAERAEEALESGKVLQIMEGLRSLQ